MEYPIAVLASDLHLSHTPPRARQGDWYSAMRTHLRELRECLTDYSPDDRSLPLVVAGDVFDTWSAPPELISFAIRELPPCWAVPGQHDLPNHSYADIGKSAYWALVEAGVIKNLEPGKQTRISSRLAAVGVPWDFEIPQPTPRERDDTDRVLLAVVHAYIWDRKRNSYDGAPQDRSIGQYVQQLASYDAAVFGDNHKGFLAKQADGAWGELKSILNCGGFMRRKTDDTWSPKVGLLYSDGDIKRITLTSPESDVLTPIEAKTKRPGEVDMSFLNDVASLGEIESFVESVKRAAEADGLDQAVASALRRIWKHVKESD